MSNIAKHRQEVEPPSAVQPSAPSKPILPEVIVLYSDGAEARPKLRRAIIGAKLIKGSKAAEEYRPMKVPRGRRTSKGHISVHDFLDPWGSARECDV
jgi:hypothetical protein